jgi:HPt (histidine-containing phosphotransfer) domain-containing protein
MTDKQMDVINMQIVQEARGLMNDRFPTMVKYFLEDTQMYLEEIAKAVKEKNVEMIISPAHTIKSSSKQLGAERVSGVAKDLEELCRNILENKAPGLDRLETLYGELKKEVDMAHLELSKLC